MQISNYSFDRLPFSKLFKTYISDFDKLSDFYETDPFDDQSIADKAESFSFTGNRERLSELLMGLNAPFNPDEAALKNIERLKEDDALVIVTGQQLGIYGGPLYTFFKTLSVIQLANRYEEKLNRPVIPVFWLADEDHDYDEIRELGILDGNEVKTLSLSSKGDELSPVADINVPEEVEKLETEVKDALYNTDFSAPLWDLLNKCFSADNTFAEGFGHFISALFSKHGLVLAGSNNPAIKKEVGDVMERSISEADEIRAGLEDQSQKLSEKFHQQVTLYDSNLFYLEGDEHIRRKISREGESWKTDSGKVWDTDSLKEEILNQPEKFSPNVFLRPILQDALLPTLGYVAGPGETAYYGQMKQMYACFGQHMPVIFPRLSATFIEPAIDRIMGELPFDFDEYQKRIEDLESEYVDRTEQHDIEAIFGDWKSRVEELSEEKEEIIGEIDPTLKGAVGNATSTYYNELDKLKGKVYRAVKNQDETQLKRINRIQNNLYPGNGLQERVLAGIFYMNKYGLDIWDNLLKSMEEESFDNHKMIYL